MRRFGGLALVMAAAMALAGCGSNLFGSSSSSSSTPTQSGNQYNSSRDAGALGPSTHDQNRD
jgi:ABC-type glycerol-3-phosphate transport system substrate-binding protein